MLTDMSQKQEQDSRQECLQITDSLIFPLRPDIKL